VFGGIGKVEVQIETHNRWIMDVGVCFRNPMDGSGSKVSINTLSKIMV